MKNKLVLSLSKEMAKINPPFATEELQPTQPTQCSAPDFFCHTFCDGLTYSKQHIAILVPLRSTCGSKELHQPKSP